LDEKNVIETPEGGFDLLRKNEIMTPHPLKEYLKGVLQIGIRE
jgi:hypothetical protein